jgi:hypothetical protein
MYAESLETIPYLLAQNAGVDPIQYVLKGDTRLFTIRDGVCLAAILLETLLILFLDVLLLLLLLLVNAIH